MKLHVPVYQYHHILIIPVITLYCHKFLRAPLGCSKDLPNSFTLHFFLNFNLNSCSFITLEIKMNILLKYSVNK